MGFLLLYVVFCLTNTCFHPPQLSPFSKYTSLSCHLISNRFKKQTGNKISKQFRLARNANYPSKFRLVLLSLTFPFSLSVLGSHWSWEPKTCFQTPGLAKGTLQVTWQIHFHWNLIKSNYKMMWTEKQRSVEYALPAFRLTDRDCLSFWFLSAFLSGWAGSFPGSPLQLHLKT